VTPDFAELFAFCDLHASRWQQWRARQWSQKPLVDDLLRMLYFDLEGFPIPSDGMVDPCIVWARLREHRDVHVARDDLPDGSWLSTVWLGIDHSFGMGKPLLFETMRFEAEPHRIAISNDISAMNVAGHIDAYAEMEFPDPYGEPGETTTQLRYATREEACAVHNEIVRRLRIREGH